jgi:excisionase family DNA binding protein
MTPKEAAEVAKVSRKTIMNNIQSLSLPATRNNSNRWVIQKEDLEDWLQKRVGKQAESPSETISETSREVLEAKLEAAHQRQVDLQDQIAALEEDRDQWKQMLQQRITDIEEDRDQWRVQASRLLSHRGESREGIWAKFVKRFGLS